jgi:hypothetical protein
VPPVDPDSNRRCLDAIAALLRDRPGFHGSGGEAHWDVTEGMLHAIRQHADPTTRSLETGCGASTVLFAAAGGQHTVVTPDPEEYQRAREYCDRIGVDAGRVRLAHGSSDVVLPALERSALDLVLIDGAHSFPFPVVDFHYLSQRLEVGGVLLLDDAFIPSVGVLNRFLVAASEWELLGRLDDQATVHRLVERPAPYDYWRLQGINKAFPDYAFLPIARRARLWARHRASSLVHRAIHRLRVRAGRGGE